MKRFPRRDAVRILFSWLHISRELTPQFFKNFIGRSQAHIKRFFKERNSTEFGMSEVYRSKGSGTVPSCLTPNKSRTRTNHRVPPAHHVQVFNPLANVRVCARKVRKGDLSPSSPIRLQKPSASHTWVLITQRIVVSKNRWPSIEAALMSGDYISE